MGDKNDKDVFLRATEVMKTDESSYRVRFVTSTSKKHLRQQSITNLGETDQSYFPPLPFSADLNHPFNLPSNSDLRPSVTIPRARNNSVTASPTSAPLQTESFNTRESYLTQKCSHYENAEGTEDPRFVDGLLEMGGQGVLIYDNSGQPSHVSVFNDFFFFFIFLANLLYPFL